MKGIGKVIKGSLIEKTDWREIINKFLWNYRSTPHSTTGIAPSVLLFGVNRKNRLPSIVDDNVNFKYSAKIAQGNEERAKLNTQIYTDRKRRAREHAFFCGQKVLLKNTKPNKYDSSFIPEVFKVLDAKGTMITARSENGKIITRDASRFKANTIEESSEQTDANLASSDRTENLSGSENATAQTDERRYPLRTRKATEFYKSIDVRK